MSESRSPTTHAHMSSPMTLSKLEHAMILHHLTKLVEYDRLIDYLCRTETSESIIASRVKVRNWLQENNMYDLTDEQIKRFRLPESPCSLESMRLSHLRHV